MTLKLESAWPMTSTEGAQARHPFGVVVRLSLMWLGALLAVGVLMPLAAEAQRLTISGPSRVVGTTHTAKKLDKAGSYSWFALAGTLNSGSTVTVSATNGPAKKLALEELVALAHESPQGKTGATLTRGAWNYQGSVLDAAGFAAERDGSIISISSDPAALAANPRPGGEDDTLFVPNTAILPTAGTPITVSLRPATPAP